MEDCKAVIKENDELKERLQAKNRELLRISQERADNPVDALALGGADAAVGDGQDGQTSTNQVIMELKNKAHLLSEENEILFQQINLLRSHYDQFNKEHAEKSEEATKKIGMFSQVQGELQIATQQRDNLKKTSAYLDQRLKETQTRLQTAEDGRKSDQQEIKKLTEQLNLMKQEYQFYKELSEKLEFRQTDELQTLNSSVRKMIENEKDYKMKIEVLEQENKECQHQNRQLIADM